MAQVNGDGAAGKRAISLALQGGGSYGAFTWGVLDRLLEDGSFTIEGISGTSAGAMNAVCIADGWTRSGAEGAREKLHEFWRAIGRNWRWSPVQRTLWDRFMGNWSLDFSPAYLAYDIASRFYSPYDLNPFNFNPLLDTLREKIDFSRVQSCSAIKVFVSATNVWNSKVRVFSAAEITAESVMASACLPHLFQAVEIDGVPYWDGGYMGNPALFPLYGLQTEDILLVQVNPVERRETPKTSREILNRLDEITFNASLLREFRAVEFVGRMIDQGKLEHGVYKKIRMHRIGANGALQSLSATSKFNTEWQFLLYLRDLGRAAAEDWLATESEAVGVRPGIDLAAEIAYRLGVAETPEAPKPRLHKMLSRIREHRAWRKLEKRRNGSPAERRRSA